MGWEIPPTGGGPVDGTCVLVASGDLELAETLRHGLRQRGYKLPLPVSDHSAVLDRTESEGADLLLLDSQIGLYTAQVVYDRFGVASVIIGGAAGESMQIADGDLAGVFGYLPRPICIDTAAVAVSVARARLKEQRWLSQRVRELEKKLEQRKVIERAKGLIMQQLGLNEPEAMRWLQKQARDTRRALVDLAQSVLDE